MSISLHTATFVIELRKYRKSIATCHVTTHLLFSQLMTSHRYILKDRRRSFFKHRCLEKLPLQSNQCSPHQHRVTFFFYCCLQQKRQYLSSENNNNKICQLSMLWYQNKKTRNLIEVQFSKLTSNAKVSSRRDGW